MGLGMGELLVILLLVLLLFGAGKLPKVMGDVAKGLKQFREGMREEEKPHSPESKKE